MQKSKGHALKVDRYPKFISVTLQNDKGFVNFAWIFILYQFLFITMISVHCSMFFTTLSI